MKKKIIYLLLWVSIIAVILLVSINIYMVKATQNYISTEINKLPKTYTCIVLGAYVNNDGNPSTVLADRLNAAITLYNNGKISRFLLTGDHGKKSYDEVNNMKLYLENSGIPQSDIFLDHAGFDTYNSMVRAKKVFEVTDAIVVTQEFHLNRAVFIARKKGLDAYGYVAPMTNTKSLTYLTFRESIARVKAYFEIIMNKSPRFLGPQIPITGNSSLSYD